MCCDMLTVHDFKIIVADDGYILMNLQKYRRLKQQFCTSRDPKEQAWKHSHTHLRSRNMALIIRDNLIRNRLPKTKNSYLLQSYIRLSDNIKYQQQIQRLIERGEQNGRT